METNLNEFRLQTDGKTSVALKDNSIYDSSGDVNVYFRNIKSHLINSIKNADIVVGCIAWFTDYQIIEALAEKCAVSIIVQKEEFLRPDFGEKSANWKQELRGRYKKLKVRTMRYEFDSLLPTLSYCGDPTIDPVRCVGNYNVDKAPAFPRMHNKFLVFCRFVEKNMNVGGINDKVIRITPYEVWTGSFNLTNNAGKSLENALLIRNPKIVQAYFKEYEQICAMSEPLDWKSDWVAPEWRIGS